jgi:hypothetical protein
MGGGRRRHGHGGVGVAAAVVEHEGEDRAVGILEAGQADEENVAAVDL